MSSLAYTVLDSRQENGFYAAYVQTVAFFSVPSSSAVELGSPRSNKCKVWGQERQKVNDYDRNILADFF